LVWALAASIASSAITAAAVPAAGPRQAWREAVVMSLARYRPWSQSQQKIRPEHLERAAVVYVRQ
jgi:hypothetical protein